MSYSLEFDDGSEPIEVGSSRGWPEFSAWVDTLAVADYPDLIALCNHGWAQGSDVISDQIAHALDASHPKKRSVVRTARGMIDALMGREPEATILVVNTAGDFGGEEEEAESTQRPVRRRHR